MNGNAHGGRRFPAVLIEALDSARILGVRAGMQPHRFIGIWVVVVERRAFVRSWSLKPRSRYRTFLEEPAGTIQIAGRDVKVRAVHTRSERLKKNGRSRLSREVRQGWLNKVRQRTRRRAATRRLNLCRDELNRRKKGSRNRVSA